MTATAFAASTSPPGRSARSPVATAAAPATAAGHSSTNRVALRSTRAARLCSLWCAGSPYRLRTHKHNLPSRRRHPATLSSRRIAPPRFASHGVGRVGTGFPPNCEVRPLVYSSLPSMPPPMLHHRTMRTTAFAASTSPPGRPPACPNGSIARAASRSTRAARLRSLLCAAALRTPTSTHPTDGTPPHLYPTPTPCTYTAPRSRCAAQHMACRPQFPVALVPAR